MAQFDKESLQTIHEVTNLIARAETLVETLGRLIPEDKRWLEWRHRALVRRLEAARQELRGLIDHAQVVALQARVEQRQCRQG